MQHIVDELKSEGYAIIRGFLSPGETAAVSAEVDKLYAEGLKHHATYRDKNLLFEVLNDPKAKRRVVLQAHWTAWISPVMERDAPQQSLLLGARALSRTRHQADHPSGALETAGREIHLLSVSSGCALSRRLHQDPSITCTRA